MRRLFAVLCIALAAGLLHGETRDKAILLSVDDAIGPAITDYIERGLDKAHEAGAEIVIIQLNTPGGLDQPPPLLGEHNHQILTGLGYSDADVEQMAASGVI